jgi:ParB family chromosome partitioning protein
MTTDANKNAPRRALGRGLDALLPAATSSTAERTTFNCAVEKIAPFPGQPRQHFDETELEELTQSIREHGVIEPIVVRRAAPGADRFEIIAGERRWRAAQRAGLKDVIVVVKDVSAKEAFEMALVENLQRADLNPIEVAEAYQRLIDEHGYTQANVGERVGKDRTTVTNVLRMLALPPRIRSMVIARELGEGHARALLGAPDAKSMQEIADKTAHGRLPVRKVEELVRAAKAKAKGQNGEAKAEKPGKSSSVRDLEARLMRRLGTRCEVRDQSGKGELAVTYASLDELDRILALLGA